MKSTGERGESSEVSWGGQQGGFPAFPAPMVPVGHAGHCSTPGKRSITVCGCIPGTCSIPGHCNIPGRHSTPSCGSIPGNFSIPGHGNTPGPSSIPGKRGENQRKGAGPACGDPPGSPLLSTIALALQAGQSGENYPIIVSKWAFKESYGGITSCFKPVIYGNCRHQYISFHGCNFQPSGSWF